MKAEELIRNLENEYKKLEGKPVYTFELNVRSMIDDCIRTIKELEQQAKLGKALEWMLNECDYPMALAERNQIDCTQGGLYITDVDSVIDLYDGLKNQKNETKRRSHDILKLIDSIDDGHHVYSGMVHQERAIAYLTQSLAIADEIEGREYQNAKRIDELNHIVESDKFQYQALCDKYYAVKKELYELEHQARIGRAVQKAFEEGCMIGKDVEYWFGEGESCKAEIETIATTESELLEWAKQEGKK